MGKSKSVVSGYHYRIAYHAGLVSRPIDAFLEYRAADKAAWAGELTASGTIHINAPMLFGGEKDQGGIVGSIDVAFGEDDQVPNAYLQSVLGDQVVAWRGMTTLAFAGGRYGAMSPFPQKPACKIRKILKGWDGECWYPEKCQVWMSAAETAIDLVAVNDVWKYKAELAGSTADYSAWGYNHGGWPEGPGGFGNFAPGYNTPPAGTIIFDGVVPTTPHNIIWIRREFEGVPKGAQMQLDVWHDDGVNVWINGIEIEMETVSYFHKKAVLSAANLASSNVVAVRVEDSTTGNNQYIYAGLQMSASYVGLGAMNPAHMLYYCRTDSEKGREPRGNINNASLARGADRLYSEGFGLCTEYDPSKDTPDSFEERICRIIGGSFERSLVDGQWYLTLARGDYDIDTLPILGDDDILEFKELPTTLDRAVNSLSVRYFDVERKEMVITPAVRALGLIRRFGEIHETLDMPEIPTGRLAMIVAERELRARITPTRAFEITTTPDSTRYWLRNSYFRLQALKRRIGDMVCILGEKQNGVLRSGAIRVKVAQDIYTQPDTTYIEIEHGVDTRPSESPTPITRSRVFEAPYIDVVANLPRAELEALPDDVGYLVGVAAKPANGLDYSMFVEPDGGDYERVANGEWCPNAVSAVDIGAAIEPTLVELSAFELPSHVVVGAPVAWGAETCRVDVIDIDTPAVTLGRGCADSVPSDHPAGSRLWFYSDHSANDPTEYTSEEIVGVKLLTNTGSQQLNIDAAERLEVVFNQRVARPYPPANVLLNGTAYPPIIIGDLTVTWVHRDRLLQADQLVDSSVASIGPEIGTTYAIEVYDDDDGSLLHSESAITGTSATVVGADLAHNTRLEVYSARDGLESWQRHVIRFQQGFSIVGEVAGGANNETYTAHLSMVGAAEPVTWSIVSGALPTGLSLGSVTTEANTISGVPNSVVGYYTATVMAVDANGATSTRTMNIGIGTVAALLHFDAADGSTTILDKTGRTWARYGNAQIDTAQSMFGGSSLLLDGAGDWIDSNSMLSLVDFGTGDSTVSCFFRVNAFSNAYMALFANHTAWSTGARAIGIFGDPAPTVAYRRKVGVWGWNAKTGGGAYEAAGNPLLISPDAIAAASWHHLRVCQKGGTKYLFIDGALIDEDTTSAPWNFGAGGYVHIGSNLWDTTASHFNGWIDEFEVIKGVATNTEGFTPPTAPSDFPVAP